MDTILYFVLLSGHSKRDPLGIPLSSVPIL